MSSGFKKRGKHFASPDVTKSVEGCCSARDRPSAADHFSRNASLECRPNVKACRLDSWIIAAIPGAVAYATSLTGSSADGEDVVQDCICRLIAHSERYDLARDGRKLLFRAITNACLNLKKSRRPQQSLEDLGRFTSDSTWEFEDSAALPPELEVLADELRAAIAEGLERLPIRYRAAIELTSLGYKPRDISQIMGIEADRMRVVLGRARKSLAAFLRSRFPE